jgi:DNA-binding SARP family transcriptional activator
LSRREARTVLEIELFGHVGVTVGGRSIEGVRNPRLLAWLLLHRDRPRTREEAAFALWPDSSDAQALTNLRRELHVLRHALPHADRLLELDHRTIRWRQPGPYRLDVDEFEAAFERGQHGDEEGLRDAVRIGRGELAPEIYDDWIGEERRRLHGRRREAIWRLARDLEARREFREAAALVRSQLAADPLDEEACIDLMRVAALSGDRAAAIQAYRACASALRTELDVEPGAELQAAYARLLAAEARPLEDRHAASTSRTRLVGRDVEWNLLLQAWTDAAGGTPSLFLVTGEAGIGKTRLIEELQRWVGAQGYVTASARCYAAEGALAYAPVAAWFRSDGIRQMIGTLEAAWLAEVSRVLPELIVERPDLVAPEPMTESWQRARLFDALVRAVQTRNDPTLLVLDDAHWADRDTLEWLHYLLRSGPSKPVCLVLVSRSEELSSNEALMSLVREKRAAGELREAELGALSPTQTAELVGDLIARPPGSELGMAIYRQTEGHPLFVVELIRGGIEPDVAVDLDSGGERLDDANVDLVPPRLRAVIASRLGQLTPDARSIAELAATFGREFDLDTLAAASELEGDAVTRALDELWQRRIVREHGRTDYDFSHDRLREVAYGQIGPVRRQLLHRRIGRAIELLHGADLDPFAAALAAHAEAAGERTRAIDLYERAAEVAGRVSASEEAARHLGRAIGLLGEEPEGRSRDERELALQLRRAPFLVVTDGYTSVRQEEVHERARELAESLDRRDDLVVALQGISFVHAIGGDITRGREIARSLLAMVDDDAELLPMALLGMASMDHWAGDQELAIEEFRRAVAVYRQGRARPLAIGDTDPRVFSLAFGAHALWLAGLTDEAQRWSEQAIDGALAIGGPFIRTIAHSYAAVLAQWRGDADGLAEQRGLAAELCDRYNFVYYRDWVVILDAWANRATEAGAADRINRSLDALLSIRGRARRPYFLSLLADAHLAADRPGLARAALDLGISAAFEQGEQWWTAELHRRLAELQVDRDEAIRSLRLGHELAVEQGSHVLALRCAIDLARLDGSERPVLAEALSRVREPSPADLAAASALLDGERSVI